jgi:hypothetical protein
VPSSILSVRPGTGCKSVLECRQRVPKLGTRNGCCRQLDTEQAAERIDVRRLLGKMIALPERWQSGRMRRFAKPLYGLNRTGGSNPPLSANLPLDDPP